MPGIIQASSISGSLDAKNIALAVLTKGLELSNLSELCTSVQVPELTATIPIQTATAGDSDLGDWETSEIGGSTFEGISFSLKKDRVRVGVSDEAQYKSRAGDPLAIQKDAAAMRLANMLDAKVVAALNTSPQTGAASAQWSTATNNPFKDLAVACAAIRPYKADFLLLPSAVWAAICGNDYLKNLITGAPQNAPGALGYIPGLGLKIYINEGCTAKSAIVGCSGAPCAALGNGPVKVRQYDDPKGGTIYQIDTWRQVVAPILKNGSSLNMAAYKLTSCIA
jgi:hypothetical protein